MKNVNPAKPVKPSIPLVMPAAAAAHVRLYSSIPMLARIAVSLNSDAATGGASVHDSPVVVDTADFEDADIV